MEKKTILAIAISFVVIAAGLGIQYKFFPPKEDNSQPVVVEEKPVEQEVQQPETTNTVTHQLSAAYDYKIVDSSVRKRDIEVETDIAYITFSNSGGTITSYRLKEHKEKDGTPVEMILDFGTGLDSFNISFGGKDILPVKEAMSYDYNAGTKIHSFTGEFVILENDGTESEPFTLIKEYKFFPGEYLFELNVTLKNDKGKSIPLNKGNFAYTLSFGPQIGPYFKKLDNRGRTEYRRYAIYSQEKRKNVKLKKSNSEEIVTERISWAGITGKYFSLVLVPDSQNYTYTFSNIDIQGIPNTSQLFISRPVVASSLITDTYRFYLGPNTKKNLAIYNQRDENVQGLMDLNIDNVIDSNALLGWLEFLLRKLLELFYRMIPNYGVAIILLTIVIKILLFPITRKSFESTSKMQSIQPKLKEVQDKFKDDPKKMNEEVSKLYKAEGVNPVGGCLPLVLQMPILIGLFGLLNKYFELRGAVFIPGWIEDLSSPESVYHFTNAINLFKWQLTDIRLLPIIYVFIQFATTFITQGPSTKAQGSNMQSKIMMYGLPLMFFFIFYDMPSGLLIYWTMTNLITLVQQLVINYLKKRKAQAS